MSEREERFDLEERTYRFALGVRKLVKAHTWSPEQRTDVVQVLRSSGSVAANYAEANNPVSSADFSHRLKIAKKEAGESRLWLRLLGDTSEDDRKAMLRDLYREADALVRIFAAILHKLGNR
ncbi:four helix bundle protein [Luteolibacter sp. Populi]|uniref:four helix bundle protein n=1 Tax=Luteolibacter sp. Populi TaxID=3230487 RepID=UPI00346616A8